MGRGNKGQAGDPVMGECRRVERGFVGGSALIGIEQASEAQRGSAARGGRDAMIVFIGRTKSWFRNRRMHDRHNSRAKAITNVALLQNSLKIFGSVLIIPF